MRKVDAEGVGTMRRVGAMRDGGCQGGRVGAERLGAMRKGGYREEGGLHGTHSLLHTPQSC